MERIHKQFRAQGVRIWGISQDDVRESQRFAKEYGLTFPILIDAYPYEASRAYGLHYVPTLFLIAPEGSIAVVSEGFCKAELLQIQKSLAKHFVSTPVELFHPSDRVPEYKPG